MKKLIASFALLFVVLGIENSFAWGQKGHDIVAYVAQCNLKKGVKKRVTRALDGHTLMYYSSWMDNIRSFPEFMHTSTWHYANVDEGYTYETMPKEPAGDVYTALTDVIEKLKDHKTSRTASKTCICVTLSTLWGICIVQCMPEGKPIWEGTN